MRPPLRTLFLTTSTTPSGFSHRRLNGRALPALLTALLMVVLSFAAATEANAQVDPFTKTFIPSTIGPGSVSTLQFDITNSNTTPLTALEFTDALPAGVTIATPANATTTCTGGTISAPDGGTSIGLSNGSIGANSTCSVTVDVTSSTPGTHSNISGLLTGILSGDQVNLGTASADLTVADDRPGFSKSFFPATVSFGNRSTLTFTIDNSANAAGATNLTFTDNLPSGMVVANPTTATTTCGGGGTITAAPGSSLVSYSPFPGGSTVAAGATCTVTVDVVGNAVGSLNNVSGELTSTPSPTGTLRSSGKASAALVVTTNQLILTKSFLNDPVSPGSSVTLRFTIFNRSRGEQATNVAFTDDLDAALSGLEMTGGASNTCGGSVSGTDEISFSGGVVGADVTCTIDVSLGVPTGATFGTYTNITSNVTADVLGSEVTGAPAVDDLFVEAAPLLTKTFLNNPVGAGDTTTVRFTITNTSPDFGATDIVYNDSLLDIVPTAFSVPADGSTCGSGSVFTFVNQIQAGTSNIPARFSLTGGSLDPGGSCSIFLGLNIAAGSPAGAYGDRTGTISATVDGGTVVGGTAIDTLRIAGPVILSKEFTDDPADPGSTVTLVFTIQHLATAAANAEDIEFTDDLGAVLSGLEFDSVISNDCGGSVTGTDVISFSGGSLALPEPPEPPEDVTCTISVSLNVPETATSGSYPNTTSTVSASVGGVTTIGNPASDDLIISGMTLTKSFTDDPVLAGETVTLEYTIANVSPNEDATDIEISDSFNNIINGLDLILSVPLPSPAGDCDGTLSAAGGNTVLNYTGGSLLAGESCSFSVTLTTPAAADPATYASVTSVFRARMDGGALQVFPDAADGLVIDPDPVFLSVSKEFTDDPVDPGDTVTLEFTVTYEQGPSSGPNTATNIAFSDDLNAVLPVSPGLTVSGSLPNNPCGTGSQLNDNSGVLALTGGTLDPTEFCTFSVTLQVPSDAAAGSYPNTTSTITATVDGNGLEFPGGEDDLGIIGPGGGDFDEDGILNENDNCPLVANPGQENNDGDAEGDACDDDDDNDGRLDEDDICPFVPDVTPPVITVLGDNPFEIIRFSIATYTDPGATATDDFNDPQSVTTTGASAVTPNLPGSFTITYTADDGCDNVATETREVNVVDDPNALAHDFLLLADDELVIAKTIQVVGDIHSNDGLVIAKGTGASQGGPTTFDSNLSALGDINIANDNTVEGDATANGSVFLANRAIVTGTVTEGASLAAIPLPSLSFSAGGADVTVASGQTQALAPGSYDDVVVGDGATLQFTTGSYFFTSLLVDDDATLAVSIPTGPVDINVVTDIILEKDVTMTLAPLGEVDSEYLKLTSLADIVAADRAVLLGQLIAPNGIVDLAKDSRLRGAICAGSIFVDLPGGVFLNDSAPGALPAAPPAQDGDSPTAVEEEIEVPSAYVLEGNYPNPFNPATRIRFGLPEASDVRLIVYDMLGRQVQVLVDGRRAAGTHEVAFEAGSLPSGTYLYRLETPAGSFVQTMLLLK